MSPSSVVEGDFVTVPKDSVALRESEVETVQVASEVTVGPLFVAVKDILGRSAESDTV